MSDIDVEMEQTRSEIAAYFRNFADELDPNGASEREATDATDATDTTDTTHGTETRGSQGSTGATADRTDDTVRTDSRPDSSSSDDSHTAETPTADEGAYDLDAGDSVTIIVGNESATIDPPNRMRLQIEVESDSSMLSASEDRMARFTLKWAGEEVEPSDDIRIE
jgi:hypothetical protein